MDTNALMEMLTSPRQDIPDRVDILLLHRWSVDELQQRLRTLMNRGGKVCQLAFEHGDWATYEDRSLVRLPRGARAAVYHASGAMMLKVGLAPMERLFKEPETKDALTRRTEELVKAFGFAEMLGRDETLSFERLWQIKARAADRDGRVVDPVLCRAVGAFRHHINGLPVLGRASVAVQIAADGVLDMVSTLVRSPVEERLERARVIDRELAARELTKQIAGLFSDGRRESVSVKVPQGLRFGYLSLPRRQVQRVLAPVYIATVEVAHARERQAMVLAVAATEKAYLPLNAPGQESAVAASSKPRSPSVAERPQASAG